MSASYCVIYWTPRASCLWEISKSIMPAAAGHVQAFTTHVVTNVQYINSIKYYTNNWACGVVGSALP